MPHGEFHVTRMVDYYDSSIILTGHIYYVDVICYYPVRGYVALTLHFLSRRFIFDASISGIFEFHIDSPIRSKN